MESKSNIVVANEIVSARRLIYKPTMRGRFIQFSQSIHDKIRSGRVSRLKSPLSVFWAITDTCNLGCKYCYAATNRNRTIPLCLDLCVELIDELASLEVCEIILEGGEPLLHPFLLDILHYIKQKGLVVSILTNATKLNGDLAKKIFSTLNSKFDAIQISLDGNRFATDTLRGTNTYDTVLSNLSYIKEVPWDNIIINCVITKQNYMHIFDMCQDIVSHTGVYKVHFSPVFGVGDDLKIDQLQFTAAHNEYMRITNAFSGKLEISGYFIPDSLLLRDKTIWNIIKDDPSCFGCCAGRSKLFIAPDGECYPCTFMRYKQYSIGKFPNHSISEIWTSAGEIDYINKSYFISQDMNTQKNFQEYCAIARLAKERL